MANVVTSQILQDGERRVVMLLTGTLDTSNESLVAKVDVSGLTPACSKIRVDEIYFVITDGLTVQLFWDATTDVRFAALTGSGELCAEEWGGFQNNAADGVTGDILLSTLGWSGTMCYTIVLLMSKQTGV